MEKLANASRGVQPTRDDGVAAGNATALPMDEASAAIRSRWVFRALTDRPEQLPRPVLDVARLALAMDMCGLDGHTCGVMFAHSKWAKPDAPWLHEDEFVALVERFSRPVRLRDQLRRRVHECAAARGLRLVTGDRDQWSLTEDAVRRTDREAVLDGWDDVLDRL